MNIIKDIKTSITTGSFAYILLLFAHLFLTLLNVIATIAIMNLIINHHLVIK